MWNVETVLDEVREHAPLTIRNAITVSLLANHWTNGEWKKVAHKYPPVTKRESELSFYPITCFPNEAIEYFCHWVENKLYPMLERERSKSAERFIVRMPECATNEDNVFCGKTICFTGFDAEDRKKIEVIAKQLGITIKTSVTSKLDYLVYRSVNQSPAKRQKAILIGIKTIVVEDFVAIITSNENKNPDC